MAATFLSGMAVHCACGFRGSWGIRTLNLLPAYRLRTICGNSARVWVRLRLKADMRGLRGSDAKAAWDLGGTCGRWAIGICHLIQRPKNGLEPTVAQYGCRNPHSDRRHLCPK